MIAGKPERLIEEQPTEMTGYSSPAEGTDLSGDLIQLWQQTARGRKGISLCRRCAEKNMERVFRTSAGALEHLQRYHGIKDGEE